MGGQYLVAGGGEQADESVAQQEQVFGDHKAHGNSACRRVDPPGGLVRVRVASRRRRSPARPGPPGSAPPCPSSVTVTVSVPSVWARTVTVAWAARACLAVLVRASAIRK
jgi:hypothetical protein